MLTMQLTEQSVRMELLTTLT